MRASGKPKRGRPLGPRPKIRHRTRPAHDERHPMHVTMRAERGLPSFRKQTLYAAFERAFRRTRRPDFRIVEYSVQSTHVHLVVEADDKDALARGMKSFAVRANRLFNGALVRKRGRVRGDRYFRRDLTTPSQVRTALVYCLANYKKHFFVMHGEPRIDHCSSARWFEGWYQARAPDARPPPTERATTALLRDGWQHLGRLHPAESPNMPRLRR